MQPLPPVGVEVGFRVGRSRQFRLESESKLDPESVGVRSFSWSRNRNRYITDPDSDWSFRQVPTFETVALFDEINVTLKR